MFADAMDLQAKTLLSMCTALNVRFIGKSHSGIDDARNIARCALVLIQEHGIVLSATSQVKGLDSSQGGGGVERGEEGTLSLKVLCMSVPCSTCTRALTLQNVSRDVCQERALSFL